MCLDLQVKDLKADCYGVLPQLENERKKLAEKSNKVIPAIPAMPGILAGGQRKGG